MTGKTIQKQSEKGIKDFFERYIIQGNSPWKKERGIDI
jgi:hypothetical protein